MGNDTYFVELTKLIMGSYKINGEKKVTLICHSMGCLYTLFYLQAAPQVFKDTYIDKLVSLAGAYGGSVNSVETIMYGYDFHMNLPLEMLHLMRNISTRQPSTYFLFPKPEAFGKKVLVELEGVNYTANDHEKLLSALDLEEYIEMYHNMDSIVDTRTGPGVDTYCFYGNNVPTVEKLIAKTKEEMEGPLNAEYGNGDGVVSFNSLTLCTKWDTKNNRKHQVVYKAFDNSNHMSILRDDNVFDYIRPILANVQN